MKAKLANVHVIPDTNNETALTKYTPELRFLKESNLPEETKLVLRSITHELHAKSIKNFRERLKLQDEQLEQLRKTSNRIFQTLVNSASLYDEEIKSLKLQVESLRKDLESKRVDKTTGLLTKDEFNERVRYIFKEGERMLSCTFIFCDVRKLKFVNDTFGHPAGDLLLEKITELFPSTIRLSPDDIFGRLGGDEFGAFLTSFPNESDSIVGVVKRFAEALNKYNWNKVIGASDERKITMGLDIGVVPFSLPRPKEEIKNIDSSIKVLMKCASCSMYRAKNNEQGTLKYEGSRFQFCLQYSFF
ncbi:MAG: GGDEF domain-containing protein [bacterium]|nr:GGDEF domain-containing protein [bacterium]